MAKVTIDQWISEVLADKTKDGPCTLVTCVHKESQTEREVFSIKVEPGQKWDSVELAKLFQRKAEMHVQGLAGHQQFYMHAHYANRVEYQARLPFSIAGQSEVSYGTTEAPTAEGRTQQGMRWGETGYQLWAQQAMNLARVQSDLLNQLANDRSKLQSENIELISVFKELIMKQAAQNHEFEMQKLKMQRDNELYKTAGQLLPVAVNALAGKEVFPQSTADSALIESLLENMKEKDIQTIMSMSLPEHIKAALAQRATEYFKKKNEAEQTAIAAVRDRNDPILDS